MSTTMPTTERGPTHAWGASRSRRSAGLGAAGGARNERKKGALRHGAARCTPALHRSVATQLRYALSTEVRSDDADEDAHREPKEARHSLGNVGGAAVA
jgi:hypothetical protein